MRSILALNLAGQILHFFFKRICDDLGPVQGRYDMRCDENDQFAALIRPIRASKSAPHDRDIAQEGNPGAGELFILSDNPARFCKRCVIS